MSCKKDICDLDLGVKLNMENRYPVAHTPSPRERELEAGVSAELSRAFMLRCPERTRVRFILLS